MVSKLVMVFEFASKARCAMMSCGELSGDVDVRSFERAVLDGAEAGAA